ncbi:hypothetical protein [Bosea sp. (in: a-proteobacteria)]|uniref:hypothetical protein n=1 Tax=Bosea sp. (in: a-proteobacteria) TaxID=1871050 RepID=UPI003F72E73A
MAIRVPARATNQTIDRVNTILLNNNEVESFTYLRSGYAYDAKIRLRGPSLVILKIRQFHFVDAMSMTLYRMWLMVFDVRADQHDRINYEIGNQDEDYPLMRCHSMTIIADRERIELQ